MPKIFCFKHILKNVFKRYENNILLSFLEWIINLVNKIKNYYESQAYTLWCFIKKYFTRIKVGKTISVFEYYVLIILLDTQVTYT